jgi:hypothetical protein
MAETKVNIPANPLEVTKQEYKIGQLDNLTYGETYNLLIIFYKNLNVQLTPKIIQDTMDKYNQKALNGRKETADILLLRELKRMLNQPAQVDPVPSA